MQDYPQFKLVDGKGEGVYTELPGTEIEDGKTVVGSDVYHRVGIQWGMHVYSVRPSRYIRY